MAQVLSGQLSLLSPEEDGDYAGKEEVSHEALDAVDETGGVVEEGGEKVRPVREQVESFNFSPETRRAAAELGGMGAEMTVVRGRSS